MQRSAFTPKAPRQKKCRHCKELFTPQRPMQIACSPACALALVDKDRAKVERQLKAADRKITRQALERLKTRADWMREAQTALNAYVRERDKDLPCISCGRFHDGQWHAGHYLSRGAHPELALEPLNLAKQCAPCNTHLSGNQLNYRKGLIARIGLEKVEWLEGPHPARRYSVEELTQIRDTYRAKLKELKRQHEHAPAGSIF